MVEISINIQAGSISELYSKLISLANEVKQDNPGLVAPCGCCSPMHPEVPAKRTKKVKETQQEAIIAVKEAMGQAPEEIEDLSEEIKAKSVALIQKHKKSNELRTLLVGFGVSKISEIPIEKHAEALAQMEALI